MNNIRRSKGEGSVYRRADGLWVAQYAGEEGRRQYIYSRTRSGAVDALRSRRADSPSDALRSGDWFERWLDTYIKPSVRQRTYVAYSGEIRRHIIPALGRIPLCELDTASLQQFLNDMLSSREDGRAGGYARSTVSHVRTRLISSLGMAVDQGLIAKNPARGLRMPPPERAEKTVFTPTQQRQFEQAVRRTLDAHPNNMALLLMLGTGLRAGEALGLRLCDIDLDARSLSVRRTVGRVSIPGEGCAPFAVGEPKTRLSRRTLPLTDRLIADLREFIDRRAALISASEQSWRLRAGFDPRWLDEGALFITTRGGLLDAPNLRRALAAIEQSEGLPRVGLHGLRHTFATRWVENGLDIKSLSELLGHSDAALTLNIYTHSLPEQKRACMDKLARLLE